MIANNRAEKCQKLGSQTLGKRKLDSSVTGCTREQWIDVYLKFWKSLTAQPWLQEEKHKCLGSILCLRQMLHSLSRYVSSILIMGYLWGKIISASGYVTVETRQVLCQVFGRYSFFESSMELYK